MSNNYHKGFDLRLFPDVLRRYLIKGDKLYH